MPFWRLNTICQSCNNSVNQSSIKFLYKLFRAFFLLPDSKGFNQDECDCPDACIVQSYAADLSYATLSSLSVDNILQGTNSYIVQSTKNIKHQRKKMPCF